MTKEELVAIEHSMTKEQIMERASTLRPIAECEKKGGMRYWVDCGRIATQSCIWNMKPIKPTGYLKELGRVTTYHTYGHPSLFKPSIAECIYQCPFPDATAFMIITGGGLDLELNRHYATTVYFSGDIPAEIMNRGIEW